MSKKLFVGNLSFDIPTVDLENAFSAHGKVSTVNIIMDRASGRSRGFAFIEMENENDAQKCVQNLDGAEMNGRNIIVNIAMDKKREFRR